jgi:hypothetical protein
MYRVKAPLRAPGSRALLKFAKATSDPQVAAALVEKAADLKDRLDGLPPPLSDVLDSHETPTQNNDPR